MNEMIVVPKISFLSDWIGERRNIFFGNRLKIELGSPSFFDPYLPSLIIFMFLEFFLF